jgi:beta-N-acetylhexosaminidase
MNIKQMTLREKLGQLFMVGFDTTEIDENITELIRDYKCGNIVLFARNIASAEQLHGLNRKLQKMIKVETKIPAFISIDQEGGMVTRVFKDMAFYPGAMATSATRNPNYAYEIGKMMGQELKALGVNFNLAPVLDVNNNPKNPVIGVRSYSDEPEVVSEYGSQFAKGNQEMGVIATAKHFPGHGDTVADSHLALTSVPHEKARLEAVELYPFKKAIEAGIAAIMTAHVLFPAYEPDGLPATLSYNVLTKLLREELGFNGLICTDSMTMKAVYSTFGIERSIPLTVKAGADLICLPHTIEVQRLAYETLEQKVLSGEISEARIDESVNRILAYKAKYCDDVFYRLDETFEDIKAKLEPRFKELVKQISYESVTKVLGEDIRLSNQNNELFIGTKPVVTAIIDDEFNDDRDVIKRIAKEFPNVETVYMENKITDEFIQSMVEIAKTKEQVVIASYNANINPNQIKLIDSIAKVNKKVSVIAMRNPYDLTYISKEVSLNSYVCVYEYTPNSIQAVVNYLKGEIIATGTCPVKL